MQVNMSSQLCRAQKLDAADAATVTRLWLLQANANVESASVKMKPPWQMAWPLSNSGRTRMRMLAWPGLQPSRSICMNSRDAWSAANIAAPTASASAAVSVPPCVVAVARAVRMAASVRPGENAAAFLEECRHALDVVVRRPIADWVSRSTSNCCSSVRLVGVAQQGARRHQRLGRHVGQALRQGRRRRQRIVGHVPDHSPLRGLGGRQLVARQRQAHGPRQTQALRQEPGAAGIGHQADLAEGLDETGPRRGDGDVAGHGQRRAGAGRHAIDRGDASACAAPADGAPWG